MENKMKYICLLTKGKGRVQGNLPDEAGVYTFDTIRDAELFKQKNEDLESKYWVKVDIVNESENIELGYPYKNYLENV